MSSLLLLFRVVKRGMYMPQYAERFWRGGKAQWGAGISHPKGRGWIALIFAKQKLWGNPLRRARVQPSARLLLLLLLLREVGCAWAHRLLGTGVAGQDTGPAWMGSGKRPAVWAIAAREGRSTLTEENSLCVLGKIYDSEPIYLAVCEDTFLMPSAIHFSDSHAYPGCPVSIAHLPHGGGIETMLAVFEDGSTTSAECEARSELELVIHTKPYTTQAGSSIPAKTWLVARSTVNDAWKVRKKL